MEKRNILINIHHSPIILFAFKLACAAGSGLLLSFTFPPHLIFPLIWIAFIPVFYSIFTSKIKMTILFSIISGIVYYMVVMGWIRRFHVLAIPFVSIVFGIFFHALPLILIKLVFDKKRQLSLVFAPALWVVFEFIKVTFFLRFPFGNIGYSQARWLLFIQYVDITGIWGISFIIIFVNIFIYYLGYELLYKKNRLFNISVVIPFIVTFIIGLFIFSYGYFRIKSFVGGEQLRAAVVQTTQDPRLDWFESKDEHLKTYERLVKKTQLIKPRLIVFSEGVVDYFISITPGHMLPHSTEILNHFSKMAKDSQSNLLFGILEENVKGPETRYYNSAFQFNEQGDLAGIYRKRELVPFGERDPFNWLVPQLQEMINTQTDSFMFTKGPEPELMIVKNKNGKEFKFGTLICYESTFTTYSRDYVNNGADFLVNMTNDLWSLSYVGMYQHALFSVFRAVENRVPIIRVSNGGYSCYINHLGKMFSKLPIFKENIMPFQLRVMKNGKNTIFSMFGDWFVYFCIIMCIGVLLQVFVIPRIIEKKLTI